MAVMKNIEFQLSGDIRAKQLHSFKNANQAVNPVASS
jgi:hypothetical protein